MTQIKYDPNANTTAGYLKVELDPSDELKPPHGQQLIHVLYWMLYVKAGRDFMRGLKLVDNDLPPEKRQLLKNKLSEYNVADDRQEAIISAHIAAEKWVAANKLMPDADAEKTRDFQENIYLQNMSFVTWQLWEDCKGHEFSMGW